MEGQEENEVRIIPLKADTVMCELTGCERPARFLVKYAPQSGAERFQVQLVFAGEVVHYDSPITTDSPHSQHS